jgi:hypothetical protein
MVIHQATDIWNPYHILSYFQYKAIPVSIHVVFTPSNSLEAVNILFHRSLLQVGVGHASSAFRRGSPSSLKFWGSVVSATSMFSGI